MEVGALQLRLPKEAQVKRQDLQAKLSIGVVINSQFGSLIQLREAISNLFTDDFVYCTISGEPLYLVHYNDLSEEKKQKVGGRRYE